MRLRSARPGRVPLRSRHSWASAAQRLRGPLYAATGAGAAYQGGYGQSGEGRDALVSCTVRHVRGGGELTVDTSDERIWGDDDDGQDDWQLASEWALRALRPDRLTFPLTLTAHRWEREVPVDGNPVRFVFVGDAGTWCARGRPHGREVSMTGVDWPHDVVELVSVAPGTVSADVPEPGA